LVWDSVLGPTATPTAAVSVVESPSDAQVGGYAT